MWLLRGCCNVRRKSTKVTLMHSQAELVAELLPSIRSKGVICGCIYRLLDGSRYFQLTSLSSVEIVFASSAPVRYNVLVIMGYLNLALQLVHHTKISNSLDHWVRCLISDAWFPYEQRNLALRIIGV